MFRSGRVHQAIGGSDADEAGCGEQRAARGQISNLVWSTTLFRSLVNVLGLICSIYMLVVYDWVLTSRSQTLSAIETAGDLTLETAETQRRSA